jgi:hypothetical protein
MSDVPNRWDLGTGEVNQVADKKITPKAASSAKTSSTDAAARVEKKSLKRHKKSKKKGVK